MFVPLLDFQRVIHMQVRSSPFPPSTSVTAVSMSDTVRMGKQYQRVRRKYFFGCCRQRCYIRRKEERKRGRRGKSARLILVAYRENCILFLVRSACCYIWIRRIVWIWSIDNALQQSEMSRAAFRNNWTTIGDLHSERTSWS